MFMKLDAGPHGLRLSTLKSFVVHPDSLFDRVVKTRSDFWSHLAQELQELPLELLLGSFNKRRPIKVFALDAELPRGEHLEAPIPDKLPLTKPDPNIKSSIGLQT